LSYWDSKRYFAEPIKSKYVIEKLGKHIKKENHLTRPSKHTENEFEILGVNNKEGLFDAYIEKGKNIKQPYQKVEKGWLAYNPYRVNVGSIGLKTENHEYDWISNAYVVFSCKNDLLPEFLYEIIISDRFNQQIRDFTAGSVRQNLTFDILAELEIPLPSKDIQDWLVSAYQNRLQQAEEAEAKANELEKSIESYLLSELGIEIQKADEQKKKGVQFVRFKDVTRWGVEFILSADRKINTKYRTKKISELCKIGSGGTPSRSISSYYSGDILWVKTTEVQNEIITNTEETITEIGLENSSAKIYPAGSLIIAMYGQGATRGRTAKLAVPASTNQACAVLYEIDGSQIDTDFLWIYIQGEYERLRALASGNNQPNLNAQMIADYEVTLPPLSVQNAIVSHINEQKAEIKRLKAKAEKLRKEAKEEFEREVFEN